MLGTGRVGLGRSLKVGRGTDECGYTRLGPWIWSQAMSWELVRVNGGKVQTDSSSYTQRDNIFSHLWMLSLSLQINILF